MENIKRHLKIKLPKGKSAFLWGARQTGKSTYLKMTFPKSIYYDFLETDRFFALSKDPSLLRQELLAHNTEALKSPIILDEVQKIPQILDEVHWLIENKELKFILCGSSARKLLRGQANLLGGRAWRYTMHPMASVELKNFDLLRALNQGLIPNHYFQPTTYKKSLTAYVQDYLKEEVLQEGLTRNIPAFSRFLEAVGYAHGELINYVNIARECGVDAKTIKEYYTILVDTLLGAMIPPFKKRQERQVISKASKFYLFDVGVAGNLCKRHIEEEKGELFGKAFEHFILMEILAYRSYQEKYFSIHFWRTKSGLEVDFILGDAEVAIEVKGGNFVDKSALKSINAFNKEFSPKKAIIVCNEKRERIYGKFLIKPWKIFLENLWGGEVL